MLPPDGSAAGSRSLVAVARPVLTVIVAAT
jgi:hypothetical protein